MCSKKLVETRIDEFKEKALKSDAEYLMHGDKPTKAFFDKYKNRSEIHIIKNLKNEHGDEVNDIRNILRVAETFYKNLFSGGPVQQNIVDLFLREISPNLECQRFIDDLLMPITDDELKDVIFKFLLGKSPGPDGFSIEFYRGTITNRFVSALPH